MLILRKRERWRDLEETVADVNAKREMEEIKVEEDSKIPMR